MKGIMAKESSSDRDGIMPFAFSEVEADSPLLPFLRRSLKNLGEDLLAKFAGRTLTTAQIYEQDSLGRPYLRKDYKDCLTNLEKDNLIEVKTAQGRKRGGRGFADHLIVTFPSKE